MAQEFKTALVIGRFQPFHKGHLYLLKKALEQADKITVAIGSSNIIDENNPLYFKIRREMLNKVIEKEGIGDRVKKIVPSPDDPDDFRWLELLLKKAGKFDVALGDNSWTNGILRKAGFKVIEDLFYKRYLYQGFVIRDLFRKGGKWQNRVPAYLVDFIQEEFSKSIKSLL